MILASRRVVLPDGVRPATVVIEDGEITAVQPHRSVGPGDETEDVIDVEDLALLPGAVDTHVHVNEPGRTEWEGFDTATRAAAAGGVTTIVDMPLNCSPVTTTVEALDRKVEAATGSCRVDCAFWGGVVPVPAGERELEALHAAGVRGFKCFLCPSGLDEFPPVSPADLDDVLPRLARLGTPLLVHAEDPATLEEAAADVYGSDLDDDRLAGSAAAWAASRPASAEVRAIELLAELGGRHGARIHVVHVAAAEALATLRRARADGVAITGETCPHYLTFAVEDVPDGATPYKCAPPIRDADNREELWEGLRNGTLDLVASDHSPCPPDMKLLDRGDFPEAWGGISSLQVALPALWTGAVERGFGLAELARWSAAAPARLAGLDGRKGKIAVGHDADLLVFDPETELVVDSAELMHRNPLTPYAGHRLRGRVVTTFLRGRPVYDRGEFPGRPLGRLLLGNACTE